MIDRQLKASAEVETPSLKPGDKGMFTATFNQVLGTGYVFRFARMQCEYLRHPHKRFKLVKLLWNFREFQAFCNENIGILRSQQGFSIPWHFITAWDKAAIVKELKGEVVIGNTKAGHCIGKR